MFARKGEPLDSLIGDKSSSLIDSLLWGFPSPKRRSKGVSLCNTLDYNSYVQTRISISGKLRLALASSGWEPGPSLGQLRRNRSAKRRGVEALGSEMVGKLSYYERWIVAFANILFQKGILTPEELALKMDEVEARWPADAAEISPIR